jgi:small multidrug resistance pump
MNTTISGTVSDDGAEVTKNNNCIFGTDNEVTCAILILTLAICLEVTGTICMKLSDGYKKIIPSIFVFVLYISAFSMVPFILKTIPLSITYAVWSGCGTVLVSIISMVFFKDKFSVGKAISILGVAVSLALLNYFENEGVSDVESSSGVTDQKGNITAEATL